MADPQTFNTQQPGNEILEYLKRSGRRGEATIKVLGKNLKFLDAFNTPVGFEILKDLCEMHEGMFDKIASLKAAEEDKIRYRILHELIGRWSEKITAYYATMEKITKT